MIKYHWQYRLLLPSLTPTMFLTTEPLEGVSSRWWARYYLSQISAQECFLKRLYYRYGGKRGRAAAFLMVTRTLLSSFPFLLVRMCVPSLFSTIVRSCLSLETLSTSVEHGSRGQSCTPPGSCPRQTWCAWWDTCDGSYASACSHSWSPYDPCWSPQSLGSAEPWLRTRVGEEIELSFGAAITTWNPILWTPQSLPLHPISPLSLTGIPEAQMVTDSTCSGYN